MAEGQGDSSAWTSPAELLARNAVRLGGVAHEAAIVERYGLEQRTVNPMASWYLYLTRQGMADAFGELTDARARQAGLLGERAGRPCSHVPSAAEVPRSWAEFFCGYDAAEAAGGSPTLSWPIRGSQRLIERRKKSW